MPDQPTRRQVLLSAPALAAATAASADARKAEPSPHAPLNDPPDPWPISLNTSTLRGHKLPIAEVIDIAAAAGYQGIEPWMDELDRHIESGGTLEDLRKQLDDHGLAVTGAIAFYTWMVDDDTQRRKALEQAKRHLDQLAKIGATHMAAPPAGDVKNVDLLAAAERYRHLLEIARPTGVKPAVEVWGGASNLHRLGQAVLIAIEANHPEACVLPDVFHLYKGGSGLAGIARCNANLLAGFHLNDYPAEPHREKIADRDRIYPGDGIAPLARLFRDLRTIRYTGPISVELFNPDYYRQDAAQVARTALRKTLALCDKARVIR